MDNRLKDIKEEMDQLISPRAFFTEEDKRAVRRRIRALDGSKGKQNRFIPLLLSFAAVAVFFFLIGGFMGNQLGLNSEDKSIAIKDEVAKPPVAEGIFFDPKTVEAGDQLGSMLVKSVAPSARYFPASPFQAVFTGSVTLSGMFHYIEESQELVFYPDQEEAKKLPAPEGAVRIPIIFLSNFAKNKDEVLGLLEINSEYRALGNVTISLYRMYFRSAGEQVDSAEISAVNGTELNLKETGNTGVLDEVPLDFTIISDDLAPVYEKFYQTGSDNVLNGLEAEEIFLLFWQAFSFNHTVTMYELMDHEGQNISHYQSFLESDYEHKAKTLQAEYEKIKANLENLQINTAENSVTIGIKGEPPYTLKKNKAGIWKLEYFFK
jgi:hypothetical protein